MSRLEIRTVPHASTSYWEAVELRRDILRRPLGLEYTPEQLAAESTEVHFQAIEDGKLVGCLNMAPQNCSVVKMRQVAVAQNRQGSGIGRALVAACEQWARGLGYTRIELHARDVAVPFYLRLGYEVEGEGFTEVGIPHHKMIKDLPPA